MLINFIKSVLIFLKNFKTQELSSLFPVHLVNLPSKENIFEIYKLLFLKITILYTGGQDSLIPHSKDCIFTTKILYQAS